MKKNIKAIIFDMDGVIIDSEPFWETAEERVFSSVGVTITPELSKITQALTTSDVTQFWYDRQPWQSKTKKEVENEVIGMVESLIQSEGRAIAGVQELLPLLKRHGYRIGLATNSPQRLIHAVLSKLDLSDYFDVVSSGDDEHEGKPHPAIYFTVAKKLGVDPESCLVFEDSHSGLTAAKRAGMRAIAVTGQDNINDPKFDLADGRIRNFSEFDLSLLN
jgi:sugar-phosphatase